MERLNHERTQDQPTKDGVRLNPIETSVLLAQTLKKELIALHLQIDQLTLFSSPEILGKFCDDVLEIREIFRDFPDFTQYLYLFFYKEKLTFAIHNLRFHLELLTDQSLEKKVNQAISSLEWIKQSLE